MHHLRAQPAGGAFHAADKLKKCAEKVNKHLKFEGVVSKAMAATGKGLKLAVSSQ